MKPDAQALLNELRDQMQAIYLEAQNIQGKVAILQMKLAELVEELGANQ